MRSIQLGKFNYFLNFVCTFPSLIVCPYRDSGAGNGQSSSLIVGLGDYSGGELAVEGVVSKRHDNCKYNSLYHYISTGSQLPSYLLQLPLIFFPC